MEEKLGHGQTSLPFWSWKPSFIPWFVVKENNVVKYAHSSRFESLILAGTVMLDLALFLLKLVH